MITATGLISVFDPGAYKSIKTCTRASRVSEKTAKVPTVGLPALLVAAVYEKKAKVILNIIV